MSALLTSIFLAISNPDPLWQVPAGAPPKGSPLVVDCGGTCFIFIPLGDRGLGGWSGGGEALPGFPRAASAGVDYRPAAARVSDDMALCFADNDGLLHLVDRTGSELPGWPVDLGSSPVTGVSALDLDSDGRSEFCLGTVDGMVHCVEESGTPSEGWPVSPGGRLEWQPTQVDMGGGPGSAMICASSNTRITLYSADGRILPGWPINTGFGTSTPPVSADLDSDGVSDIIFATADRKLNAVDTRGSRLQGWPYTLDSRAVRGASALGVVDCEAGRLQVAVSTESGLVYLIDPDGTLSGTWRWPVQADGKPTQPVIISTWDGNAVAVCTDRGRVLVWDSEGREMEERCLSLPEGSVWQPAAADLDGNGITDLVVVGIGGTISAFPIGSGTPPPWPQELSDQRNTGIYALGSLPRLTLSGVSGEVTGDIDLQIESSGGLILDFVLSWSTDAGFSWTSTSSYTQIPGGLRWRSRDDLPAADEVNAMLRVTPRCSSGPGIAGVSQIFHLDNNSPPVLHISLPEMLPDGGVGIHYAVEDEERDLISIEAEYSSGGGWMPAQLTGSTLELDPWLYGEPVTWTPPADLAGSLESCSFRMRAVDRDPGPWSELASLAPDSSTFPGQVLVPGYEVSGRILLGVRMPGADPLADGLIHEFSLDGGDSWRRASVAAPGEFDPTFYDQQLIWDSSVDAPGVDSEDVRFRIRREGSDQAPVPSPPFHVDNNRPPQISVVSPGSRSVFEGLIPMILSITDAEGDQVMLGVRYRLLHGEWATASGILSGGPAAPGGSVRLDWNTGQDLPDSREAELGFVVFAADADTSWSEEVTPIALTNGSLPGVIQASASQNPETGSATVMYEITDPAGRTLDLDASFSLDGGITWRRATVSGTLGSRTPPQYRGSFEWLCPSDLPAGERWVMLRLTPFTSRLGGVPRILDLRIEI